MQTHLLEGKCVHRCFRALLDYEEIVVDDGNIIFGQLNICKKR